MRLWAYSATAELGFLNRIMGSNRNIQVVEFIVCFTDQFNNAFIVPNRETGS